MRTQFNRALFIAFATAILLAASVVRAQIYVSRYLGDLTDNGMVGKYNFDGSPVNAALIPGLLAAIRHRRLGGRPVRHPILPSHEHGGTSASTRRAER